MKFKRFRIIEDSSSGFEVQYKYWFLPFWIQSSMGPFIANTHSTLKDAKKFIKVIKENKNYTNRRSRKIYWSE